jgi:hypothetical protein
MERRNSNGSKAQVNFPVQLFQTRFERRGEAWDGTAGKSG